MREDVVQTLTDTEGGSPAIYLDHHRKAGRRHESFITADEFAALVAEPAAGVDEGTEPANLDTCWAKSDADCTIAAKLSNKTRISCLCCPSKEP